MSGVEIPWRLESVWGWSEKKGCKIHDNVHYRGFCDEKIWVDGGVVGALREMTFFQKCQKMSKNVKSGESVEKW